jgi:hypothetical protein
MATLVPSTVLLNSHSGGRVARGYPVLTGRGPSLVDAPNPRTLEPPVLNSSFKTLSARRVYNGLLKTPRRFSLVLHTLVVSRIEGGSMG